MDTRGHDDNGREQPRIYTTPTLVDYGAVAKLTQGSLAVGSDGTAAKGKNAGCL